jgi:hypothetical protein
LWKILFLKRVLKYGFVVMVLMAITPAHVFPQEGTADSARIYKHRQIAVGVTGGALYVGSMIGLYNLWYKDYPQSSFHIFNDNRGWMQIDKIGHTTSAYHLGRIGYEALDWAGVKRKKAIWIGGSIGFVYLATVEIFDGFSAEWGASTGDFISNAAGTAMFISQQLIWDEQRLMLKFSYMPSQYADVRKEVLGENWMQRVLKDYNGQTYWLSGNIHSFIKRDTWFPRWLNIAVGYGADGMLGANSNPEDLPYYQRYRQYYLSLDVDLTKIRTNSKFLKGLFTIIGFLKIPSPTLEYNEKDKIVFHFLYF